MDGGVYRFTPARWHDLSEGLLEIATVGRGGKVSWSEVPDPGARRVQTRDQVRGSTRFKRAEGIWHDDGVVYISTTGDHRVHVRHRERTHRRDLRRARRRPDAAPARRPAHREPGGEVFVCEDIATAEIDIGLIDRAGRVSKFSPRPGRITWGRSSRA